MIKGIIYDRQKSQQKDVLKWEKNVVANPQKSVSETNKKVVPRKKCSLQDYFFLFKCGPFRNHLFSVDLTKSNDSIIAVNIYACRIK